MMVVSKLNRFMLIIVTFFFVSLFSGSIAHGDIHSNEKDKLIFEKLLIEWTEAFNRKDIVKTCDLFSKTVTATYRGAPKKNYETICNGFKKIFAEKDKNYQYRFEMHEVYRSLDLAVIRVTWYLTIDEPGKKTGLKQDEGLDVLQQDSDKQWKIVNFLGFEDI